MGFPGGSVVKNSPANARDAGLIHEWERYPGVGNGNPLQYFCLKNCMDRGDWQAAIFGVAKKQHDGAHMHAYTVTCGRCLPRPYSQVIIQ